jgi:hypothetical protein
MNAAQTEEDSPQRTQTTQREESDPQISQMTQIFKDSLLGFLICVHLRNLRIILC